MCFEMVPFGSVSTGCWDWSAPENANVSMVPWIHLFLVNFQFTADFSFMVRGDKIASFINNLDKKIAPELYWHGRKSPSPSSGSEIGFRICFLPRNSQLSSYCDPNLTIWDLPHSEKRLPEYMYAPWHKHDTPLTIVFYSRFSVRRSVGSSEQEVSCTWHGQLVNMSQVWSLW